MKKTGNWNLESFHSDDESVMVMTSTHDYQKKKLI